MPIRIDEHNRATITGSDAAIVWGLAAIGLVASARICYKVGYKIGETSTLFVLETLDKFKAKLNK